MTDSLSLSSAAQRTFKRLATDLRRVSGERLVALVAYGPGASAAFATPLVASVVRYTGNRS